MFGHFTTLHMKGLNCTISFESYMVVMRVRKQKKAIKIKIRAIEQIFVLDHIKHNIIHLMSQGDKFVMKNGSLKRWLCFSLFLWQIQK